MANLAPFKIQPLQCTEKCPITVKVYQHVLGLSCSERLQHLSWSSLPGLAMGRSHSWVASLQSSGWFWELSGRFNRKASTSPVFSFSYLLLENIAKQVKK